MARFEDPEGEAARLVMSDILVYLYLDLVDHQQGNVREETLNILIKNIVKRKKEKYGV